MNEDEELCTECGEYPATDEDGLCDLCSDDFELAVAGAQ